MLFKCNFSSWEVLVSSYLHTLIDVQAHIEQALHGHFLFRKLTDSQCQVLLDCMRRVEVKPGDVVVQQVIYFVALW